MIFTHFAVHLRKIMVHTGLTTFYSRTFPGLSRNFNNVQGVRFHRRDITLFNSHSKKAIPVSANNVIQPKDRIVQNHSFSFSGMELNFLSIETRSLSFFFADRLKAFAWVTKVNLAVSSTLEQNSSAVSLTNLISSLILFFFFRLHQSIQEYAFFFTIPVQFFNSAFLDQGISRTVVLTSWLTATRACLIPTFNIPLKLFTWSQTILWATRVCSFKFSTFTSLLTLKLLPTVACPCDKIRISFTTLKRLL